MSLAASIVVATYQRRDRVLRLLRALGEQRGVDGFEVVVVDDGSTDGTVAAIARVAPSLPYAVRVVSQVRNGGPASARNRGWQMSSGPIVAFTDDDCTPAPGWLAALLAGLDGADLVSGPTTAPPGAYDQRGPWSYWMEDDGQSGYFSTCNIAYRREVLDAVGGFDEAGFRYRGRGSRARRCINGEDTDMAWRAIEAGFRAAFADGALVEHEVFPSDYRAHLDSVPRLAGLVLLIKKHPQLRRHFGKGLVYRTEDVAAGAFFAGGAALGVRRLRPAGAVLSLVGLGWYLRIVRGRPRPAGLVRATQSIAMGLVADGYAGLVMLRASARYRTLLL
ncbi:MAG: glycosyltransferase family 2 protein [Actinomycetota bacterium]|nr:glycosyltransferase family 2 protein [Actinomycetota bacterium]